ncbi:MAG: FkbM family methyltransferase [Bacteroidetes bacterium]|nr:FkbM family methyltransferase [Bacteroidota bacterium]
MHYYLEAKKLIVFVRKILLADFPFLIRWYYKIFWKAKKDSIIEFIDRYSKANKNLFFIQVGSNDGFQNDLLYKFILRDRWEGMVIEPQPKPFKILSYIYRKRNIITVNKAVDEVSKSRRLYKIAVSESRWASGLSSFDESKIKSLINNKRVLRKCRKEGIKLPLDPETFVGYEEVSCIPFNELIDNYSLEKINILQIDTEGYDFELLKQFDFNKIKPKVIIFENIHLSAADKQSASDMLKNKGYQMIHFASDTLAIQVE